MSPRFHPLRHTKDVRVRRGETDKENRHGVSFGFALLQPRSKSTRRQSRLESEVRAGRRQLCQTAQHETARFKSYRLGRILAKPLSDDVGIYEMLNLEEATEQRGRPAIPQPPK